MAAAMQLNTLMSNMFATGLLDDQFQQLQMLQDESAPDFVAEVFTLFCEDGDRIIGELAKQLEKPCVDFDKVSAFVHQLKGSSASVGAQRVKHTCMQFREFCQEKSRYGCLDTLDAVRNDFYDLRSKFQTMLQGTVPLDQDRDIAPLLTDAHRVADQFCEQFRALRAEVAILEAENIELRRRLKNYPTPLSVAPPSPPRE